MKIYSCVDYLYFNEQNNGHQKVGSVCNVETNEDAKIQ